MGWKAALVVGAAAGYVLGTKAGRQRYEQIKNNVIKLRDNPNVQEATGYVQAKATELASAGKDVVGDKLSNTKVGDRLLHGGNNGTHVASHKPTT